MFGEEENIAEQFIKTWFWALWTSMYDGTPSNSNESHLSTMLQKLEKCEVKDDSVEI